MLVGVLALAVSGCSSSAPSTTPSPPVATSLSESATDAIADTVLLPVLRNGVSVTPDVAILPDLVAATIDVSAGNLTGTISLAPGTFSHTDTFVCLLLDVDENPSTGGPSAAGDVALGYDYSICAVNPRRSATAQVSRLGGGVATGIGSVPATFVSADAVRFTVPLSLLGGDEGRMAFKVTSNQWVDEPVFNTGVIDWMPDLGRAAGLTR